jgi:hypothetical protein
MKKVAKILGVVLLAGAATVAVAAPADARVSVGIGLGGGYYGPPAPAYSCDPYSRFYDPYYCGAGYPAYGYGPGYYGYGPSVVIGGRFGGGFHGGNFHGGGRGHR